MTTTTPTAMMTDVGLSDGAAREAISTEHHRTLFVDAGAGSGKTTALVDRLLRLVRDAGIAIERIAAITFTDAAAAELRTRVREALEAGARDAGAGDEARTRCEQALEDLDDAAILTLHSFAQRILSRHPVEAGLPPAVEIHDEVTSVLGFEERWREMVQRLLDDDELEEVVHFALALGLPLGRFEAVARQLNQNWDLLEDLRLDPAVPPISVDPEPVLDAYRRALAHRAALPPGAGDPLVVALDEVVAPWVAHVETVTDRFELLALLDDLPTVHGGSGRQAVWGDAKADVHAAIREAKQAAGAARSEVSHAVLTAVGTRIAGHVLEGAQARRRSGRLEFHDLLVLARAVVRHDPDVRHQLHVHYERLLIDEFQDTDPIQAELAVRIAAAEHHPVETHWRDIPVPEGRLFFVGDGNQSIYRFRRADPQLYAAVRQHFVDGPTQLAVNFRSVPGILEVVNAVFAGGGESPDATFIALDPYRDPLPEDGGPAVMRLGEPGAARFADGLREAEADDVARAVGTALDEKWLVHDEAGGIRPAELSDITILIPARTSLPHLERALGRARIPYRIETGTLIYSTAEISDLALVLGAIADPADFISIAGALRTAAYGCGDDDLYSWHHAEGSWSYFAPPPEGAEEHPVAQAMADLRARHDRHVWQTVPETVEEVIRERRLMEAALVDGRHRDAWRRYRVVIEHARQFADDASGRLRDFLRWAELQRFDTIRPSVAVLPERDLDAVRIMTIHGAKGLEFPIAVVSGLTKEKNRAGGGGPQVILDADGLDVRIRKEAQTGAFEARQVAEDQMDEEERLRLLYVALTRARDHLVVSTHHKPPGPNASGFTSHGHLLWEHLHDRDDVAVLEPAVSEAGMPVTIQAPEGPPPDVDGFRSMRERITDRQRRFAEPAGLGAVAATGVAALMGSDGATGGAGDELEMPERPPWRRGRAGTSVGRATHAVLQHADLGDPDDPDLAALARHHAAVEGVGAAAAEVEAKACAALRHPVVRAAAAAPRHWREVPVEAAVAGVLLEGFIDLLFEAPEGLVVVDYKTDAVRSEAEVAAALDRYTPQGAAYAVALEEVTGRTVARVVFLFLRGHEAHAAEVVNLGAATSQVRAALERVGTA
jgi:ATP-dependent exoDNAse (exonuclease V) beta subunit